MLNWKRLDMSTWQGPKKDYRYFVEIIPKKMLNKTVYEVRISGFTYRQLADFDSHNEAVIYAIKWMKQHPTMPQHRDELYKVDYWGVREE